MDGAPKKNKKSEKSAKTAKRDKKRTKPPFKPLPAPKAEEEEDSSKDKGDEEEEEVVLPPPKRVKPTSTIIQENGHKYLERWPDVEGLKCSHLGCTKECKDKAVPLRLTNADGSENVLETADTVPYFTPRPTSRAQLRSDEDREFISAHSEWNLPEDRHDFHHEGDEDGSAGLDRQAYIDAFMSANKDRMDQLSIKYWDSVSDSLMAQHPSLLFLVTPTIIHTAIAQYTRSRGRTEAQLSAATLFANGKQTTSSSGLDETKALIDSGKLFQTLSGPCAKHNDWKVFNGQSTYSKSPDALDGNMQIVIQTMGEIGMSYHKNYTLAQRLFRTSLSGDAMKTAHTFANGEDKANGRLPLSDLVNYMKRQYAGVQERTSNIRRALVYLLRVGPPHRRQGGKQILNMSAFLTKAIEMMADLTKDKLPDTDEDLAATPIPLSVQMELVATAVSLWCPEFETEFRQTELQLEDDNFTEYTYTKAKQKMHTVLKKVCKGDGGSCSYSCAITTLAVLQNDTGTCWNCGKQGHHAAVCTEYGSKQWRQSDDDYREGSQRGGGGSRGWGKGPRGRGNGYRRGGRGGGGRGGGRGGGGRGGGRGRGRGNGKQILAATVNQIAQKHGITTAEMQAFLASKATEKETEKGGKKGE